MSVSNTEAAVQTKVFRVEQFRNPEIPAERRSKLEAAEAAPLDLSVEGILADAKAQAGLSDFGPTDFTERLGQLAGEVAANTNLWRHAKERMRGSPP